MKNPLKDSVAARGIVPVTVVYFELRHRDGQPAMPLLGTADGSSRITGAHAVLNLVDPAARLPTRRDQQAAHVLATCFSPISANSSIEGLWTSRRRSRSRPLAVPTSWPSWRCGLPAARRSRFPRATRCANGINALIVGAGDQGVELDLHGVTEGT